MTTKQLTKRFGEAFARMQLSAWEVNEIHGFHDEFHLRNRLYIPTALALIASEVSEALEAHRNKDDAHIGEELADVVIRTMDLAESLRIDLAKEILNKTAINRTRPFKHGNKRY